MSEMMSEDEGEDEGESGNKDNVSSDSIHKSQSVSIPLTQTGKDELIEKRSMP